MGAVVAYDLSTSCGWAVWHPKLEKPRHDILRLPPPRSNGSIGPALKLLFEHIGWVDRNYGPLDHIGFEAFLAATGGDKDKQTKFITSPRTQKSLIGFMGVAELCAEILNVDREDGECTPHSIHNASWRRFWLGSQKRGTTRETWKALAVDMANRCGWHPKGDDDADALGQLHFLLDKLHIVPSWQPVIDRAHFRIPLV